MVLVAVVVLVGSVGPSEEEGACTRLLTTPSFKALGEDRGGEEEGMRPLVGRCRRGRGGIRLGLGDTRGSGEDAGVVVDRGLGVGLEGSVGISFKGWVLDTRM